MLLLQPLRFAVLAADLTGIVLAWFAAFWLRFNLDVPPEYASLAWRTVPWALAATLAAWFIVGVPRQVWRYISLAELWRLALACALAALLAAAAVLALRYPDFPRSVFLLFPMLALLLLGGARAASRLLRERQALPAREGQRLLVIGDVADAADALRALKGSHRWAPVAIVSPLAQEAGRSMQSLRVMAPLSRLADAARSTGAGTALVASPPGSPARRDALMRSAEAGVTLLTMPRPDEWLKAEAPGPRRVVLEDLLGREPVALDVAGLADMISGQTVMVTGAGGSIGSELCRQVARLGAARLVCVDASEYAIYQLEQELRESHVQLRSIHYTANVREADRLHAIGQQHRPALVLHAAACKHVPLMEQLNEVEALRTNVLGTLNAARMAGACGARRFVMISTDKAVNPTNVMGASKRLAERVVQAVGTEYPQTQYVSVRFGNVLGSSGSVVPLFEQQIARGGPVTVTHPDIVRYFMTIAEAAQLVLQAGMMGRGGQIFVLDMGEPVRIVELARMLIRLSGKTEQEVPIVHTGLRPGEKLYEELLADDETTQPTPHPKLRIARGTDAPPVDLAGIEQWVLRAGPAPDGDALRRWLREWVPEYEARLPASA